MKRKSTRSKIESFRKEFISLARKGAGGYATIADRQRIGRYFLEHLENTGIKLRGVDALKVRYVESYIEYRKSLNLSNRTLQNEMSVLRGILSEAGKHRLADPKNERLNNQTLGISGVNRDGTKTALTRDEFLKAFKEIEKQDRGVAATMRLAYVFGLRTKEPPLVSGARTGRVTGRRVAIPVGGAGLFLAEWADWRRLAGRAL